MEIRIAHDAQRAQRQAIEGPTRKQARRMAERRETLLAQAAAALAAGDDVAAFDRDCEAFDIECDLRRYGFAQLIKTV